MKTTLVVIENDADHVQAKALIEQLMGSKDPADEARMTGQAHLIEAYEYGRRPRRAPSLPDLLIAGRAAGGWRRSKFNAWPNYGLAKTGHIGLQGDHSGTLAFRNIRIRELK